MPKIFYGWWVVLACFMIAFCVAGVTFYGFTAFIDPLVDEFGWSYTQVSFAASLRGMEMGILAPIVVVVIVWAPAWVFLLLLGGVVTVAADEFLGMARGAGIQCGRDTRCRRRGGGNRQPGRRSG